MTGCATSAALNTSRKKVATKRMLAAEAAGVVKKADTVRAIQVMAFQDRPGSLPGVGLGINLDVGAWEAFRSDPWNVLTGVGIDALTVGIPAYLGYLAVEELNDNSADITINGNNNTVGDSNTTTDTDSTDNSDNSDHSDQRDQSE
jgi:hypothetical protein